MINRKDFQDPSAYHDRLQSLGAVAVDVLEYLITDMETPIDVRISAAFKAIELCGAKDAISMEIGKALAEGIQRNANELSYIESLVKKEGETVQNNAQRLENTVNELAHIESLVNNKNIGKTIPDRQEILREKEK